MSLSADYSDDEQLDNIKNWCSENLSSDIKYFGSPEEQYQQYFKLIRDLPENLDEIDIFVVAKNGYDRIISEKDISIEKLNMPDRYGRSVLHLAASGGHLATIVALLAKGACPRQQNRKNQLPIHCVLLVPGVLTEHIKEKRSSALRVLLEADPDTVFCRDNLGNTIFHYMVISDFEKLSRILFDCFRDGAFCHNNLNRYPVHMALLRDNAHSLSYLLNIDGVSQLVDSEKRMAIHYAVIYKCSQQILELCCNKTPDINVEDTDGSSPLLLAIKESNVEAAGFLVSRGARVELNNRKKYSLLHYAVFTQDRIMISWAIESFSQDIDKIDVFGKKPFDYCRSRDLEDLFLAKNIDTPKVSK